ncbi:MAG: histidine kinase N-terminal 7TM domain-containing protein [Halobaculum sp.]
MSWVVTPYSLGAFLAAGLSALLALAALRNRSEPSAEPFAALMIALGAWSGLYGVQLGFDSVIGQLVWFRSAIAVAAVVPTLWLLFALRYSGEIERLSETHRRLLAVEPAAVLLLVLTNWAHGLFWRSPTLATSGQYPVLDITLTNVYFVHVVYSYVLILVGIALLGRVVVSGSSIVTTQASLLIVGTVPPTAVNAAYTLGVSPVPNLDVTPFAFVVTGVVWSLALFQFDFLDRSQIAQRRVIHDAGSGLVVVDDDGAVVEANDIARDVFDPSPSVGDPVGPLLPDGGSDPTALDGTLETAVIDDRKRVYDLDVTALEDHRDRTTGHVVVARDVTERHAYEQRLEVANRVLRHNLSNDMNLVVGHARQLEENVTDDRLATAARTIRETGTELIDASEKAREMIQFEEDGEDPVEIDACRPAFRVVTEFRESHPDASISLETPDTARVVVGSEQNFLTALRNLVENALEHHDGEDPSVTVRVETDGAYTRVSVADDGPGLPEMERATFEDETETPLRHGSGLGLWLAHWTVTAVGGDITFTEREPRGTEVTLSFPIDCGE